MLTPIFELIRGVKQNGYLVTITATRPQANAASILVELMLTLTESQFTDVHEVTVVGFGCLNVNDPAKYQKDIKEMCQKIKKISGIGYTK